jgi:hypothetical protein
MEALRYYDTQTLHDIIDDQFSDLEIKKNEIIQNTAY